MYPVWNATLTRDAWKLRPYLRLTNLSNTGYQEISGVNMPPRTIMGGVAVQSGAVKGRNREQDQEQTSAQGSY